jgi:hypothetical protein
MHVLPRAGISNQGYQSLSEELPRDGDPFSQTGPTELKFPLLEPRNQYFKNIPTWFRTNRAEQNHRAGNV